MKYCDLSDNPPPSYKGGRVWCYTHELPAEHCGPDGDTPVCAAFACFAGCNCCPENYKKSDMTESEQLNAYVLGELYKAAAEADKTVMKAVLKDLGIEVS